MPSRARSWRLALPGPVDWRYPVPVITDPVPTSAPLPPPSLYEELAEPAPLGCAAGETISTRAKETVDNDVETFDIQALGQHV
jgi:hypothetical protein